mgnify:FL=1
MKEIKSIVPEMQERLIKMTAGFCNEYLDEEYKGLCEKLILKMSRKRNVPFLSGRIEIWAAAVIYTIGSINFLFDKSFKPYVTAGDICNYFGTSQSTTSQKAKLIRDMFKLEYWNKEFSTRYMMESSPFLNLTMLNGLIVDKRTLPPEIRKLIETEENSKK